MLLHEQAPLICKIFKLAHQLEEENEGIARRFAVSIRSSGPGLYASPANCKRKPHAVGRTGLEDA
jgi:hypothetical protein